MLALLAITTAATMAGFSGYWVRRAPAFRVSWLLAGAAALIIGLAGALAAFDADPTVTTSMVAVAVVLVGSSPVLAVRADGNLGLRWVGILDLLAATLAGGILTWAVLIEPGWFPSGAAGRALAVAVALAVASTLAAITLARSARSYPVSLTIAAGLAVFIAGLGWSREELRTGGLTATSSAVGLALAAMLIGAWASTRFQVESSLPWSFTQQLRNTIGFYLFIALLIAGSVAAVQDGVSTQAVLVVRVASLALVFARFSSAYRHIVTLQDTVASREALLHLPVQAASVQTEVDLQRMLDQMTQVAAERFGASRAELFLHNPTSEVPYIRRAAFGLTSLERDLLVRTPDCVTGTLLERIEQPFLAARDDLVFGAASRQAWSVASKDHVLVIPLRVGDRLLGYIDVWTPIQESGLDVSQLDSVAEFGRDAAMMIEHGRLMLASRGEIVEAEMLLAISEVFSRAERLYECLPVVAERLVQRAESDRVTISLIDDEADEVFIAADAHSASIISPSLEGVRVKLQEWVSYQELQGQEAGRSYLISSLDTPPRLRRVLEHYGAQSYLAIPGYTDGRMTSIVQIMSSSTVLFHSPEIQNTWRSIARQLQLGIESIRALETTRRQTTFERMRRRINESMQSVEHLEDVHETIADLFREIEHVDGVTILRSDDNRDGWIVEAEWTNPPIPARLAGTFHKRSDLVILRNIEQETGSRMKWVGQKDNSERQRARMASSEVGAALAVPLRIEDHLVGALILYSAEPRPIRAELSELAEALASSIALVIKAVDLRVREEEQREEQMIKLRMLQAATADTDPFAALRAVSEAGLGYAGAESINITFFDETRQSMVIAADSTIAEWPGVEDPGTVLAIEPDSLQDRALRLIEPQHYSSTMPDLGKWEIDDIEEYGAHSWICAPLRVGGRAIGLLQVLARQPDAFDQRRIRLWDEVAQQVSLVISTLQVSFDNQRLSRHQELLTRINAASGSSSSAAEVYRTIAETGLSLPGVESSALFLWYEEDNLLEAAHHAVSGDWFTPYEPGTRMTPAAWLVGDAPIRRWETTHIWFRDETLPDSSRTYLETIRCGRAALFMLIEEGNVLGVLSLKARDDGPFPEETINLAESIATASAAIVRNVRARTADRQAEREQTALLTLSRAATASASEEELLEVIVTSVRDLADARGGAIFFLDAETGAATVVANVDPERGMLVSASGLEHGADYWTVELARRSFPASTIVQDLTDERLTETMRAELTSYGVQSIAWTPLSAGDRIIGLIAVYSDQPRRFTTAVTRSVATFAGQAALALEHTRQRLEDARLAEQRALLLQVSRAAGISLDLKQVLAGIAEASLNVARSESCGIELYLPETDELVLSGLARVNDWVIAEDMSDKTRPYGSWSIDYLVRTHGSVVISSIDDPRIQGTMREDMTRFNTQSIMAHALSSGGQFIGIYYLFARKPNAYAEGDRWLTGEIATHIVAAIQNARLLEQEQTTAQERERLLHISEAATRSLDLHDVLHEIAQATLGLAGAESCHVELIDHERSQFITAAYAATDEWAAVDDVQIGDRCRIGDWSIDMASITSREPISIGSKDDPRVAGQMREDMIRFGTESILFIPIWLDDVCVGILNIYSRRPNAFSTAHLTIASTLGTHAANAIQNAQTHERERERRRHQEALLTVTSAATSSLDVNIAMHEVCKAICKVADAESAVVGVFHPEMNAFEIVADVTAADWDYADEPGRVYPLSGYPSYDRVLSSPSAFVVDRTTPEDEMRAYIDNSTVGLETYVLAPLYVNETCLGYVGLFDRRPGQFGRPVLELMDAASQLVGLALSNGLQWREEQRRAADRAAVVAVGRIAVSEGDVSTKLDRIATTCLALHRIDGVAIFQWEPIDHTLTRLVSQGTAAWLEHGHPCERYEVPGDHELRKCVESPEPSRFELADPDLHPQVRKALGECGAESLAIFPLRTEERIEGILVFYGLDPYPFDSETLSVGREIATQTALTMRASRLLETAHTYARQQSALLAANQAVMNVTQSSIAEVLETISRETMRLLDAECCEIERLLPEKDATKIIAEVSIDDWFTDDIVGKEMPLADWPITRRVLYSQQAVTLSPDSQDLTPDEWDVLFSEDTRSVIMAPMVLDGQSCGAICFYSRKPDAFTSEKLVLAREFGSLVALAIDRAETHMALAQRAMNDGLTGLLNHRALVEQIDHHIAVAARTEVPVSLLMIDMNNFKQVNDEHGHLAGDEVLRQTATFLRRTLRASDLVGRYGGDEFVAILPGTDVVQAISLRERLQESAKTLAVLLPNGSTVVPSFAIGYSSYPGQADDAESLIEVADRSMYEAKSHVRAQKAPVSIAPVGTDTLRVVS